MGQRRYGYESGFEDYLRASRVPYVSVNEAQRTLRGPRSTSANAESLKSFDFVVYGEGVNLLVDIKGRRGAVQSRGARPGGRYSGGWGRRLESWVTREDVSHLLEWERLFGAGFRAAFVFVYAFQEIPPDGLFAEVYPVPEADGGGWHALRVVGVREYAAAMRERSPKWGTVELCGTDFDRLWHPLGWSVGTAVGVSRGPAPARGRALLFGGHAVA